MNAYDLIDISVGPHTQSARPIEWDGKDIDGAGNDSGGNQITPIAFMTTCPACAQLVQFKKDDIYVAEDGTPNNVKCESCNLGKKPAPSPDDVHDLVVVLDENPDGDDDELSIPSAVFIDPIMSGEFDIPIDADKL